jgi:hypothetical protein
MHYNTSGRHPIPAWMRSCRIPLARLQRGRRTRAKAARVAATRCRFAAALHRGRGSHIGAPPRMAARTGWTAPPFCHSRVPRSAIGLPARLYSCASPRRIASCATPTSSAGHGPAGATASPKLIFPIGPPVGAGSPLDWRASSQPTLCGSERRDLRAVIRWECTCVVMGARCLQSRGRAVSSALEQACRLV